MKLLYCGVCNDLIQLRNDLRGCCCGCQIGRYLDDNHTVEIASKYIDDGKLIGVSNRLLMGDVVCDPVGDVVLRDPLEDGGYFAKQNSNITVIPWNSGDTDVVYGEWDAMRATLLSNMQAELFGELTDPAVARDKLKDAFAGPEAMNYTGAAARVGCGVSHMMELLHVLALDDVEAFEALQKDNKRMGTSCEPVERVAEVNDA